MQKLNPLLTVENLQIAFGDNVAVKSSSFAIQRGEILALVGESGSGKTLTALSIMGLLPKDAAVGGEVTWWETDEIRKDSPIRQFASSSVRLGRDIAMIFQEPMTALNPLHTIERQIGEMIAIHQPLMKKPARHARILELLDKVGLCHLRERLNAYPHQLSGGERQRVMIATAIANNPKLLIADEPTTAVDVTIQKQILELLQKLQKENGMSILLITHDLTIVRRVADRIAIMHKGEIVEQGKTTDIFASPANAYTQKLLGSEPKGSPPPLPPDSPLLLEAKNMSVKFPLNKGFLQGKRSFKVAVNNVSLILHESETLGIVGESGSGKSSLGYALLRLVKSKGSISLSRLRERAGVRDEAQTKAPSPFPPLQAGEGNMIHLHSLTASQLRPLRKEIQIVFQDPFSSLNPRMTVEDIIAEGLYVQSRFAGHESPEVRAAIPAKVDRILVEVGLSSDIKNRYPHEFSGGQRQRIAIARAMVLSPRLVILDEPTSALDLTIQAQIIELLAGLQQKYKTAYLFISHDLRVVKAVAHRILVMKEGKVIEEGATETLFAAPREEYTKSLMDAAFL